MTQISYPGSFQTLFQFLILFELEAITLEYHHFMLSDYHIWETT